MSWLSPVPARGPQFPRGLAPVQVRKPALSTSRVTVRDEGEPLVPVRDRLPTLPVYDQLPLPSRETMLLRASVLDLLTDADAVLEDGWRICVIDAWRPLTFQRALLSYYAGRHAGSLAGYVADPDAAIAPPHCTGGTVDVTLAWNGEPLALGTDFDEFSQLAAPAALEDDGAPRAARLARRLLAHVLGDAGFVVNRLEWWHWEFGTHYWGEVTGTPIVPYGLVDAPDV